MPFTFFYEFAASPFQTWSIEYDPFWLKSYKSSFTIFKAYNETLISSIFLQSTRTYLFFYRRRLNYGLNSSIIGSHLPISIFQQLAFITPFIYTFVLLPYISTSDFVYLRIKSKRGTGSSVIPSWIWNLLMKIEYFVFATYDG